MNAQTQTQSDPPKKSDDAAIRNSSARSKPEQKTDIGYRSVCKSAVICFVLAVFSLAAYMSITLIILPVVGIGFGILALASLRRYPDELVGRLPARVGFATCLIILVSGIGFHIYSYMTEVPEGYERISFYALKPRKQDKLPYAKAAEALDGKKVFLKGYVRPSDKKRGLNQFILVGSFGSCCFGGTEKITNVVAVSLLDDATVDYGIRLRHIGGTFRLNKKAKFVGEDGVPQVFYSIEADYLR